MGRARLPEKLYRIGEIMEHTGLTRQTLHFYATLGLITEKRRTPSGYRLFPPSVFGDLERIRKLQKQGRTLRDIRRMVETKNATRKAISARMKRTPHTTTGTERGTGPQPRAGKQEEKE